VTAKVMSALACVLNTASVSKSCEQDFTVALAKTRCRHCRLFEEACEAKALFFKGPLLASFRVLLKS
jgi:hypothetical protein